MKLTSHLHLVPRLRISEAIRLSALYTFMSWTETTLLIPYSVLDTRLFALIEIVTIWYPNAVTSQSGTELYSNILVIWP